MHYMLYRGCRVLPCICFVIDARVYNPNTSELHASSKSEHASTIIGLSKLSHVRRVVAGMYNNLMQGNWHLAIFITRL
jgi:hypothetical protein